MPKYSVSFYKGTKIQMCVLFTKISAASQSISNSLSSVAATAQDITAVDLENWIKPFNLDALANGFATLIGALFGAMLAYVLQRKFQSSLDHKNNLISAHRLMFAILQQINTIVLIQRDYVYKEITNPCRFLSIPATPPYDTNKNVLQLPELAFLITTKEGRAILYDFYVAQENYIVALNQWNIRSVLHVDKVQPSLAGSGIANGSTITSETLQNALGVHLFGSIVNSTDNCVETLQRAFQKLAAVKVKTRAYLVAKFKTDDFTDFDFTETYGLAETAKSTS